MLLGRRSADVVNAANTVSVVPAFGMEPNLKGKSRSRFSLRFYNFLKEFLEEVFDAEELTDTSQSRTISTDAIFDSDDARQALRQFETGAAHLIGTGFGLVLTQGNVVYAMHAHFSSPDFYEYVRTRGRGSWEANGSLWFEPVEQVPELLVEMPAPSAFAVDLALSHLRIPN